MSDLPKDGNVIHIPEACNECWFYCNYRAMLMLDNDAGQFWCGLLCRHLDKDDGKECEYTKVIIK
jgi:hypothetical protein